MIENKRVKKKGRKCDGVGQGTRVWYFCGQMNGGGRVKLTIGGAHDRCSYSFASYKLQSMNELVTSCACLFLTKSLKSIPPWIWSTLILKRNMHQSLSLYPLSFNDPVCGPPCSELMGFIPLSVCLIWCWSK